MSNFNRPDLSGASPEVLAYIEALEAEVARLGEGAEAAAQAPLEPAEPPTTLNVISISANGLAKRTPRHHYARQRRGGMGVFDIETGADDRPRFLVVADEAHELVLLTNLARAFHLPVSRVPEAPVRARGEAILAGLGLQPGERLAAVLPAGRGAAVALLSERGFARVLPAHVIGPAMAPGTSLYRAGELGPLVAACWTTGDGDLFVASRRGLAIRFPERALPLLGGLAMRLEADDSAVAVEAVRPPEGEAIFLLGGDGRGSTRLMAGFAANKAPGGGGKLALRTSRLIGAVAVSRQDDLFVQSQQSKLIRFRAEEVPAKEGVVQGVACMALRSDECVAVAASPA